MPELVDYGVMDKSTFIEYIPDGKNLFHILSFIDEYCEIFNKEESQYNERNWWW